MNGWEREIIEPFEALVAPWKLVWKEKYGTLRVEFLYLRGTDSREVGPMERVLEEASRLCCMDCGRWNGWMTGADTEAAKVETKAVRGWVLTLCSACREKAEAKWL